MRIRPARADEAQALADIAWAAKSFWPYPRAQLEAWRASLSPSAASIAERPTVVAELDNTAAGFYQLNVAASPAQLEHLWVHPDGMRQGVGITLLAHAMQHLSTLGINTVHVDADPNAEGFYRRCGAQRIGEIAAPIAGQTNRVRPQLRLSASDFSAISGTRAAQTTDTHRNGYSS